MKKKITQKTPVKTWRLDVLRTTFIFLALLVIGYLLMLSLIYIILPSYISYKVICTKIEPSNNWIVLGQYNAGTGNISIYVNESDPEYKLVMIHERVHEEQSKRKGLFGMYGCSYPRGYILNELEANIRESWSRILTYLS